MLDQAVAIEHRMNGAFGGNCNSGKSADAPFADFSRTPAGVLSERTEIKPLELLPPFRDFERFEQQRRGY